MKHYLTITVSESGETLYCKRFALLGNYIIGRSSERCYEASLAFSDPTTVLVLPQTSRHLSGFHCVLFYENGYHLIDGWGQYKSTNGVQLNGRRVEFAALAHGDVAYLGCDKVELKYEFEREVSEEEKETLSST